jgi:hypothetical protein
MRLRIPFLRSSLAVVTGILVTALLVITAELTVVTRAKGVATIQIMKQIWVLDVFAAVLGGYVTALVARHSALRHAAVAAGLFLFPVGVLGFLSSEPPLQIFTTSFGIALCICLGAIGQDWQRQRSRSSRA